MNEEREKLRISKSERNRIWYQSLSDSKKKERYKSTKEYFVKYPWLKSYYSAKDRVFNNNPKHILYHGIEFSMTKEDFKEIWFRDKAYEMEFPSIDRIDSKKGYIKCNCRFLEKRLNIGRSLRERTHCNNGHEFTKENTWKNKFGSRRCNTCRRIYDMKRYYKLKLAGLEDGK